MIIVESYNFGVGGTQCPKANPKGLIDTIKHEVGIFVPGGVRVKRSKYRTEGQNFFDIKDKTQNIIEILNIKNLDASKAKQFGFVPNIDFIQLEHTQEVLGAGCTPLYQMNGSMGDNCGSFALKVAAAGMQGMESGQISKRAVAISNMFVGPDEMLPILHDLGWVSFAMSF